MNESSPTTIESYNQKIRRSFDQKSDQWLFSIVDVISIAVNTSDARNYWKVLKNRLKKTQNQLVTGCKPIKMEATDGKFYLTDAGNKDTILQILKLVSVETMPYFESYFDSLASPKSANTISLVTPGFERKRAISATQKDTQSGYPQPAYEDAQFILSVDIYSKKNILFLEAFIAGVSLSDIEITATLETISIKGHREMMNKIAEEDYTLQEISWGKFYKHVDLPCEIDINKVEARDDRGLLIISMPIVDKSYTRKVKVD